MVSLPQCEVSGWRGSKNKHWMCLGLVMMSGGWYVFEQESAHARAAVNGSLRDVSASFAYNYIILPQFA